MPNSFSFLHSRVFKSVPHNFALTIWGLLISLVFSTAFPDVSRAAFIDLQLGARPQGMGGAFVALADDANAAYWNPAGIKQSQQHHATFMHGFLGDIEGLNFDFLAYTQPAGTGSLGLYWLTVGATLEQGEDASTSRFATSVFALAYALPIKADKLYGGLTLKRFTMESIVGNGAGMGFDGGLLFLPTPALSVGFVARNIAADIKDEKIPSTLRLGFAGHLLGNRIRPAIDLESKSGINGRDGMNLKFHGGVEIAPHPNGAIRGGYDADGPTFGVSFNIRGAGIDYAFRGSKILGSGHRIAAKYMFGGPEAEPVPKKPKRVRAPRETKVKKPKLKKPKKVRKPKEPKKKKQKKVKPEKKKKEPKAKKKKEPKIKIDKKKIEVPIPINRDVIPPVPPSTPTRPTPPINAKTFTTSGGVKGISWEPAAGPSPAGYNVYVAQGSGKFQKLTPKPINVVRVKAPISPLVLRFYITTLDAAGNESAPSNTVTVKP